MKTFDVVLNLHNENILVGYLGAAKERKLIVNFKYDPEFLAGDNFFNISPELYATPETDELGSALLEQALPKRIRRITSRTKARR